MQYFIDNNNQRWEYEDDVDQSVIDAAQVDNNIIFTSLTHSEFQDAEKPPFTDAQIMKIGEIDAAFAAAEELPVTALSQEWPGDYLNSTKYKAIYDYAVLASLDMVDFKDATGMKQTLSLADAKTVLLAIGADYIAKESIKDDLLSAVNSATTQAELDAIEIIF